MLHPFLGAQQGGEGNGLGSVGTLIKELAALRPLTCSLCTGSGAMRPGVSLCLHLCPSCATGFLHKSYGILGL